TRCQGFFAAAGCGDQSDCSQDHEKVERSHRVFQRWPPTPPLSSRLPSRGEGSLTAMPSESGDNGSVRIVPADDPRAMAATEAVQAGDLAALECILTADPWLATARVGDSNCYRTLLHAATDWPGHFPNGPAVVARLVAAGGDVNAHSQFSHHTETPLHWAASSDDVAVLDALLDAGAD